MFEVSVDFHDSASPRRHRFESYSDLALFLERVPNTLGFLANNKATIEVAAISSGGPTLFDIET